MFVFLTFVEAFTPKSSSKKSSVRGVGFPLCFCGREYFQSKLSFPSTTMVSGKTSMFKKGVFFNLHFPEEGHETQRFPHSGAIGLFACRRLLDFECNLRFCISLDALPSVGGLLERHGATRHL